MESLGSDQEATGYMFRIWELQKHCLEVVVILYRHCVKCCENVDPWVQRFCG